MRRLGFVIALTAFGWAHAADAEADSPFELELKVDVPLISIGAGLSLMGFLEVPPPQCFPRCDDSAIHAVDRVALGHYSEGAHSVATVAVAALLALPLALNAIDSGGSGWIEDTLVYGEALLFAQALVQLTKFAVRRTAPFVYDPNAPEEAVRGADASRSFISGHAAMAFAATTAYATTFWQRNPESDLRWVVAGAGALLSLGVGILKIFAGYHFVTDIVAGALVGAGVGALVPLLHVRD